MKKLVVLMLVVGMASLASAALSLSVNAAGGTDILVGTTSVTIDVTGSGIFANDSTYFQISPDTGAITGGAAGADAPSGTMMYGTSYASFPGTPTGQDGPWGFIGDTTVPGVAKSGSFLTGFNLDLSGVTLTVGDTILVTLAPSADFVNAGTAFTLPLNVVPEPMTMALLGLGGLFLRRKK